MNKRQRKKQYKKFIKAVVQYGCNYYQVPSEIMALSFQREHIINRGMMKLEDRAFDESMKNL